MALSCHRRSFFLYQVLGTGGIAVWKKKLPCALLFLNQCDQMPDRNNLREGKLYEPVGKISDSNHHTCPCPPKGLWQSYNANCICSNLKSPHSLHNSNTVQNCPKFKVSPETQGKLSAVSPSKMKITYFQYIMAQNKHPHL